MILNTLWEILPSHLNIPSMIGVSLLLHTNEASCDIYMRRCDRALAVLDVYQNVNMSIDVNLHTQSLPLVFVLIVYRLL